MDNPHQDQKFYALHVLNRFILRGVKVSSPCTIRSICLLIFWGTIINPCQINLCQAKALNKSHPSIHLGVIDQIDPPWLVVMNELGETFYVSLSLSKTVLKEGQWVIYVEPTITMKRSIYPLNSHGIRQFKQMISRSLQEQLNRLKQSPQDSNFSIF